MLYFSFKREKKKRKKARNRAIFTTQTPSISLPMRENAHQCKSAGGVLSRARCAVILSKFLADSCNLTRHTKSLFKRPASHLFSPVSFHHQPPVDRRTRILPGKLTCTYVFNICGFGAMTGGNTSYRSLLDLVFDSRSLGPADFWRLILHGANFSLAAGLTSVSFPRNGRVGRAVSRCNGNPLGSAC